MKSGRTLLTIACRLGSKGVHRKCERMVFGKPLAQWTIEQALKYKLTDPTLIDVVLSTDSPMVMKIGRDVLGEHYNWVDRPEKLWGDDCGKPEVLKHILYRAVFSSQCTDYGTLIDLDVCNPLREKFDIVLADTLLKTKDTSRVISVARAPVNPFFNAYTRDAVSGAMVRFYSYGFSRRQDAPTVFVRNNSIFAYKTEWFENMDDFEPWMPYYMPDNTGGVDVDHEHNLRWLEREMHYAGF